MLAGVGDRVRFEAQPAVRLEELARSASPDGAYPFVLSGVEPIVIETAGIVAAVARDIDRGEPAAVVARRFHTTVVELIAAACTSLASSEGVDQVVLSGGCFQNAILAAEVPVRLAKAGLRVHTHRQVPPNDGGLCLGQLAIAAAQAGGG